MNPEPQNGGTPMKQCSSITRGIHVGLVIAVMGGSASAEIVVNAFGPDAYDPDTAAMDAALGVAGFLLEDFEDTTLIEGLTYTLDLPFVGTFDELPGLHDGRSIDGSTDNQWDGIHVLLGNANNSFPDEGTRVHAVRFDYPAGARSLGVGLASFQSLGTTDFPITDHNVYVNGQFVGVLETLAAGVMEGGRARNAYLRIDATGPDVITSVGFENTTQSGIPDLLVFDHIAIDTGACAADVAPPFGVLDLADVNAFVTAFVAGDPLADLAPPFGLFDLNDVLAFVGSFNAGCP